LLPAAAMPVVAEQSTDQIFAVMARCREAQKIADEAARRANGCFLHRLLQIAALPHRIQH
jgi:hypothetical protein